MKIYVDMDNVLVDFMKVVCKMGGVHLNRHWDFEDRKDIWDKIKEEGVHFWKELPWMPDGKELWNALKKYNPIILSAPTRENTSIIGKKAWIKENIPGTETIIDQHKYKYAEPGDILIDDMEKNTSKWEEHGGIAILHKNAKDTLKKLKEIMSRKKKASDYSQYIYSTPVDGGEYYALSIPEGVEPPALGTTIKEDNKDIVVVSVSSPQDVAKGRGGPVARSMKNNGIAYLVNCLPEGHERLYNIREYWNREAVTKIKPYDALVSEVVREMGTELKDVDVIVLEPTCTGNVHGYVHNQDLLMSRPGEERIIHLCLPKIKQDFRKQFNENYNMGNPNDQKKMKQMLKDYLRGVVLPHEMTHIQQELEHGGEFGPSPETQAEKAEDWSVMAPYGLTKREASVIVRHIDKIANKLEYGGHLKEAYNLDVIANTIEKKSSIDKYWENVIEWMNKNIPVNFNDLKKWMDKGFRGIYRNEVKDKAKEWEKVISSTSTENVRHIVQTSNLEPWELEALTMPIKKWVLYAQMNMYDFIKMLENK